MTTDPESTAPSGAPASAPPAPAVPPADAAGEPAPVRAEEPAPVSADVPADEPVAPAPVDPPAAAPEPVAPDAPSPEAPAEPAPPAETPAAPAEPEATAVAPVAPPAEPAPVVAAPTPVEPVGPAPSLATAAPVADPAPAAPAPVAPPPAPPAPPAAPAAPADAPASAASESFASPTAPVDVPATPELASAVPAPEPDAETAGTGIPSGGRGVLPVVAAVVAVLLLAGAMAAWFGPVSSWRDARRLDDRRQDAVNQARQLALNIGTLNHQRLDEDLRRIAESTTGKARAEFDEKILKNEAYKKLVRDNQAELSTTIVRLGLQPCGNDDKACLRGDTVVALVFLDQESKNKLRPTPRVDRNRVALTLVRNGDTWLISEVQVL